MRTVLWILAGCLVCSAQTQQPQKPNSDMPVFLRQLADTRKTIADGYVHWTEAAKAKDVDAIADLYADDATILPEGKESVSGKGPIRDFYKGWFADSDKLIDQKFENVNSVQEGDLLIDSTKFSGTLLRDGKEVPFRGKRLTVWKREL